MCLADPDEIGMHAGTAEALVVGRDHDVAVRQHVVEAGDGAGEIGERCRRATLGDAGGVVGPGNDAAALARRRPGRKETVPDTAIGSPPETVER
jgi:hypothetical protein